ncbi:hypothetical protein LVJ94_08085 [Pendulispora rubella]|uniref:Photosynthesis system II assembly factor Ycf48/Hcf136-like domain-containing protein n=1 Tax=Pendulispora rubella TaxID=2741070 RepID=A0ABZ2L8C9_9BACT
MNFLHALTPGRCAITVATALLVFAGLQCGADDGEHPSLPDLRDAMPDVLPSPDAGTDADAAEDADTPETDAGPADDRITREAIDTKATLRTVERDFIGRPSLVVGGNKALFKRGSPVVVDAPKWEPLADVGAMDIHVLDAFDAQLCVADGAGALACSLDGSPLRPVGGTPGPIASISNSPEILPRELRGSLMAVDGRQWYIGPDYQLVLWPQGLHVPFAPIRGTAIISYRSKFEMYAVGANGALWVNELGHEGWAPRNSGTTRELRSIGVVDEQKIWAVGDEGTIVISYDGGATWYDEPSPTNETLRATKALYIWHGEGANMRLDWYRLIVGDHGTVLLSVNDNPFERIASGTHAALLALTVDGDKFVAVGERGTILRVDPALHDGTDGGTTR